MKRNIIFQIAGGCLGLFALLNVSSCSDDHYDIVPGTASASNNIWENVQATPQLDSLAMILQRVHVFKDEDDTKNKGRMTYAELLASGQTFTLFAPFNGTYNASAYLAQLDTIDALRSAGKYVAANELDYDLANQFAANHIARFNYESEKTSQEIRLYNGKICVYSAADSMFNDVKFVNGLSSIPSTNGVIHVLDGISPFAYNLFDYMKANAALFDSVYSILSDPSIDTKTFSESASSQGAMNENGQMVYVDSVYVSNNELLNQAGASIKNEDSLYVAVIPTNTGWTDAYNKVKKLFKYKNSYYSNWVESLSTSTPSVDYDYTNVADSLSDYNTKKALMTSMYFSPSIFYQKFDRTDTEGIVDYVRNQDSLISTNGVKYFKPEGETVSPLFAGNYTEVSNGIIFPLDTYPVDPSSTLMTTAKQEIEAYYESNIGNVQNTLTTYPLGQTVTLTEGGNLNEEVDISGLGNNKYYRYFAATSGYLRIFIPLRNLYSGYYRIKVQVLPNRVNLNKVWRNSETGEEIPQNTIFYANLLDDAGKNIGSQSKKITVEEDGLHTYTLWDKIELPYCYAKMTSEVSDCYPILRLVLSDADNDYWDPNVVTEKGLSLVKVIVEPVAE